MVDKLILTLGCPLDKFKLLSLAYFYHCIGISSFIKHLSSNFKDDPDNMAYLNLANNW